MRRIEILHLSFALDDRFAAGQILSGPDAEEFNLWQASRFKERAKKLVYKLQDGEFSEAEFWLKIEQLKKGLREENLEEAKELLIEPIQAPRVRSTRKGSIEAEVLEVAKERLQKELFSASVHPTELQRREMLWEFFHLPDVQQEARRRFAKRQEIAEQAIGELSP